MAKYLDIWDWKCVLKKCQLFINQPSVGGVKRFCFSTYIRHSALVLLLWEVRGKQTKTKQTNKKQV